jgi:hypothetical protein
MTSRIEKRARASQRFCAGGLPRFWIFINSCQPSIITLYRTYTMSLAAPIQSLRALAPARNAFASHVCQRRSISSRPQLRRPSVTTSTATATANRTQQKHASHIRVSTIVDRMPTHFLLTTYPALPRNLPHLCRSRPLHYARREQVCLSSRH